MVENDKQEVVGKDSGDSVCFTKKLKHYSLFLLKRKVFSFLLLCFFLPVPPAAAAEGSKKNNLILQSKQNAVRRSSKFRGEL
ncbi:hypothetical protein H5410_046235 [Solanum commersonii]|uniref:Uncharacterized protein n=1 Tax=Solanum commersonii TaxID=4109 RepID=A0A9J5XBQ5_SOLCO|nr:hypothetical protein H5410_046235 [Solanum commersonii]